MSVNQQATQRGWIIFNAVISIIAGLVVIFRPGISAAALIWVLGFWLIVRGVTEIIAAFAHGAKQRWLLVLGGVFWIVAGIVAMTVPAAAVVTLALWMGILA